MSCQSPRPGFWYMMMLLIALLLICLTASCGAQSESVIVSARMPTFFPELYKSCTHGNSTAKRPTLLGFMALCADPVAQIGRPLQVRIRKPSLFDKTSSVLYNTISRRVQKFGSAMAIDVLCDPVQLPSTTAATAAAASTAAAAPAPALAPSIPLTPSATAMAYSGSDDDWYGFWTGSLGGLGSAAEAGSLLDLGELLHGDAILDWEDVFRSLEMAVSYNGKVFALPLHPTPLLLLYRRDLLGSAEEVPASWDQLLDKATELHGRDLDGDGRPEAGICARWYAGCPGAVSSFAHALLATYMQADYLSQGIYFQTVNGDGGDEPSLEPLLDSPAAVDAMELLLKLRRVGFDPTAEADMGDGLFPGFIGAGNSTKSGAPSTSTLCADPVTRPFLEGRCVFSLSTFFDFKAASHTSSPTNALRGHLGAAPIPGSSRVLLRNGEGEGSQLAKDWRLVNCSQVTCPLATGRSDTARDRYGIQRPVNRSPYIPASMMAVNYNNNKSAMLNLTSAAANLISFYLASDVASPGTGLEMVLDPATDFSPIRKSQMTLELWTAAGYNNSDAAAVLPAYQMTLESSNPAFELRMKGQEKYGDIFEAMLGVLLSSNGTTDVRSILVAASNELRAAFNTAVMPYAAILYNKSINDGHTMVRPRFPPSSPPPRPLPPLSATGGGSHSATSLTEARNVQMPSWGVTVVSLTGVTVLVAALLLFLWRVRVRGFRRNKACDPPGLGPDTTLLLSDIADSTALWEILPADVMDRSVRLHSMAVRYLLVRHRGYESATEGDAFIAAFGNPLAALNFACDLQVLLLRVEWPEELLETPEAAAVYVVPAVSFSNFSRRRPRSDCSTYSCTSCMGSSPPAGHQGSGAAYSNHFASSADLGMCSYNDGALDSCLDTVPSLRVAASENSVLVVHGAGCVSGGATAVNTGCHVDQSLPSGTPLSQLMCLPLSGSFADGSTSGGGSASAAVVAAACGALTPRLHDLQLQAQRRGSSAICPRSGQSSAVPPYGVRSLGAVQQNTDSGTDSDGGGAAAAGLGGGTAGSTESGGGEATTSATGWATAMVPIGGGGGVRIPSSSPGGGAARLFWDLRHRGNHAAVGNCYSGMSRSGSSNAMAAAFASASMPPVPSSTPLGAGSGPSFKAAIGGGSGAAASIGGSLPSRSRLASVVSADGKVPAAFFEDWKSDPNPGFSQDAVSRSGPSRHAARAALQNDDDEAAPGAASAASGACTVGSPILSHVRRGSLVFPRVSDLQLQQSPLSMSPSGAISTATMSQPNVMSQPGTRAGAWRQEHSPVYLPYRQLRTFTSPQQPWEVPSSSPTRAYHTNIPLPGPLGPSAPALAVGITGFCGSAGRGRVLAAPAGRRRLSVNTSLTIRPSYASATETVAVPSYPATRSSIDLHPPPAAAAATGLATTTASMHGSGASTDSGALEPVGPPCIASTSRLGQVQDVPTSDNENTGAIVSAGYFDSVMNTSGIGSEHIAANGGGFNSTGLSQRRMRFSSEFILTEVTAAMGSDVYNAGEIDPSKGDEESLDIRGLPQPSTITFSSRRRGGSSAGAVTFSTVAAAAEMQMPSNILGDPMLLPMVLGVAGRSRSGSLRRGQGNRAMEFLRRLHCRGGSGGGGGGGGAVVTGGGLDSQAPSMTGPTASAFARRTSCYFGEESMPNGSNGLSGEDGADLLSTSRTALPGPGSFVRRDGSVAKLQVLETCVSYLSYMQRLWQLTDCGHQDAVLIHRGLRLRLGIHTGLRSPSEIALNRATGRTAYSGAFLAVAREVSNAGPGGCIMLSEMARRRLVARGAFKPGSLLGCLYMGHYSVSLPVASEIHEPCLRQTSCGDRCPGATSRPGGLGGGGGGGSAAAFGIVCETVDSGTTLGSLPATGMGCSGSAAATAAPVLPESLRGAPPGLALYQVVGGAAELFTARWMLQPKLKRCGPCQLLGSPEAPVRGGGLAVAEVQVQGINAIMAWNLELGSEALRLCLAAFQRLATARYTGGGGGSTNPGLYFSSDDSDDYVNTAVSTGGRGGRREGHGCGDCRGTAAAVVSSPSNPGGGGFLSTGRMLVVSEDVMTVVAWAADVQTVLARLPWRDELLVHEYCAEVAVSRNAWEGAVAAAAASKAAVVSATAAAAPSPSTPVSTASSHSRQLSGGLLSGARARLGLPALSSKVRAAALPLLAPATAMMAAATPPSLQCSPSQPPPVSTIALATAISRISCCDGGGGSGGAIMEGMASIRSASGEPTPRISMEASSVDGSTQPLRMQSPMAGSSRAKGSEHFRTDLSARPDRNVRSACVGVKGSWNEEGSESGAAGASVRATAATGHLPSDIRRLNSWDCSMDAHIAADGGGENSVEAGVGMGGSGSAGNPTSWQDVPGPRYWTESLPNSRIRDNRKAVNSTTPPIPIPVSASDRTQRTNSNSGAAATATAAAAAAAVVGAAPVAIGPLVGSVTACSLVKLPPDPPQLADATSAGSRPDSGNRNRLQFPQPIATALSNLPVPRTPTMTSLEGVLPVSSPLAPPPELPPPGQMLVSWMSMHQCGPGTGGTPQDAAACSSASTRSRSGSSATWRIRNMAQATSPIGALISEAVVAACPATATVGTSAIFTSAAGSSLGAQPVPSTSSNAGGLQSTSRHRPGNRSWARQMASITNDAKSGSGHRSLELTAALEVYEPEVCRMELTNPLVQSAAALAASGGGGISPGSDMVVLFRGLRLRIGMDVGWLQGTLSKTSGRISYRGRPVQRARRFASMAKAGQVLCSRELVAALTPATKTAAATAAGLAAGISASAYQRASLASDTQFTARQAPQHQLHQQQLAQHLQQSAMAGAPAVMASAIPPASEARGRPSLSRPLSSPSPLLPLSPLPSPSMSPSPLLSPPLPSGGSRTGSAMRLSGPFTRQLLQLASGPTCKNLQPGGHASVGPGSGADAAGQHLRDMRDLMCTSYVTGCTVRLRVEQITTPGKQHGMCLLTWQRVEPDEEQQHSQQPHMRDQYQQQQQQRPPQPKPQQHPQAGRRSQLQPGRSQHYVYSQPQSEPLASGTENASGPAPGFPTLYE
ncbi:hypothetical protein Vafri_4494 [Volvox africanus]|uniref:Guanylate cyclase domain-containing protein n=1 Tax=Volvox africanus TaxID=51714 RepID=A0A8J4EV07_9CHLO|nr:hypothetical protein Vafri_4494 [Volvox africanus]